MALQNITGQPLHFGTIEENDLTCQKPSPYCALYKQSEDTIKHQFIQTPCGESVICNGDFEATDNLVVNGGFDTDTNGWTLDAGSGSLNYAGQEVRHTGGLSDLSQSITGLEDGQTYYLTFTVSGMIHVDSFIKAQLGGGSFSDDITSDGTYTIAIIAGSSNDILGFVMNEDVNIDNIILTGVNCWSGEGWNFNEGSACHDVTASDPLVTTVTETLVTNDYYVIHFSVFGMTGGTLDVTFGGDEVATITENGTYTFYTTILLASDNLLVFQPQGDFDGCVSSVSAYKLLNPNELSTATAIVDLDGNFISYAGVVLIEDRVVITKPAIELDEGCYKIVMLDLCNGEPVGGLTEINQDVPFDSSGTWDVGHATVSGGQDGSFVVTGGKLVQHFPTSGITTTVYHHITQDYNWPVGISGGYFTVTVQTGNWDNDMGNIYLMLPGQFTFNQLYRINPVNTQVDGNTTYTRTFFAFIDNDPNSIFQPYLGVTTPLYNKFGIAINLGGYFSGQTQELLSFSVQFAGVYPGTSFLSLESNCLKVLEDTGNAQLMVGTFDEVHSYGFVFNPNFFSDIRQRLFLSFVNPHNPGKSGNFLQSNSVKRKTYAQRDYAFDLIIHPTDIITHRAVTTILDADHCYIGISEASLIEYNSDEKDYAPDYGRKGESPLGEAITEITRVSSTKFNLNQ